MAFTGRAQAPQAANSVRDGFGTPVHCRETWQALTCMICQYLETRTNSTVRQASTLLIQFRAMGGI
jgi:hypothetical protein